MSKRQQKRQQAALVGTLVRQKKWLEKYWPGHGSDFVWIIVGSKTRNKAKASKVERCLVDALLQQGQLFADPTGALRTVCNAEKTVGSKSDDTRFASQHRLNVRRLVTTDNKIQTSVLSNEAESPLGWLKARRDKSGKTMISQEQFDAGERLRTDFTQARMMPRTTASWEFSNVATNKTGRNAHANMEISDRAIAAKKRFFAALDELGDEMSQIVLDVCCLESGFEAAERQLGWPRRSGKLVLQMALTRLAQHYGLVPIADQKGRVSKIMQWGEDGYRPQIPPAAP